MTAQRKSRHQVLMLAFALCAALLIATGDAAGTSVATAAPPHVPLASTGGLPFGQPAFDSGWRAVLQNTTLEIIHNLGGSTDRYYVVLEGREDTGLKTISQYVYGTDAYTSSGNIDYGIFWADLDATSVHVRRGSLDMADDLVRVRIWLAPPADYDSGWFAAINGSVQTRAHNLGGNVDDYLVYYEYRSAMYGVNQMYYGGDTYHTASGNVRRGGYWTHLTTSTIWLWTGTNAADHATDLRVRIWRVRPAEYDSGWTTIAQDTWKALTHDLGGPWNDFVVDMQFKDTDGGDGISTYHYGRDCYYPDDVTLRCYGAFWYGLDTRRLSVYRAADDTTVDQVRIRIWASSKPAFARTIDIGRNTLAGVPHHLGGNTDDYVVDLQFVDTLADGVDGGGVNQWNYGGDYDCVGSNVEKYGAYWRYLNDTAIQIQRLSDDRRADQVNIRIWVAPPADYDSGWFAVAQGATASRTHSLGGNVDDYVVYLEFRGGLMGLNQRSYGRDLYQSDCATSAVTTGAYWYYLTATGVSVARAVEDQYAPEMRIRIWENAASDYESGWTNVGLGGSHVFPHNLGNNPAGLIVYMTFKDIGGTMGVHNYQYGSDGHLSTGLPQDFGAYWRSLTPSAVRVVREAHDATADQVSIRMWRAGPSELMLPLITR